MSTATFPEQFKYDPNDTAEERERKHAAFSEWCEEQQRSSREGAIHWSHMADLDMPLLRFLTDEEVRRTHELACDMYRTLEAEGMDAARALVLYTLVSAAKSEQVRREHAAEDARVSLEANGHEVRVIHDSDDTWFPSCHCGAEELEVVEPLPDREQAVQLAVAHAAEHNGAWADHTD